MKTGKLQDKVALITGASSGIGLATAALFKAEGARVVMVGRNRERLEQTRTWLGDDVLALVADVSRPDELRALMARVGQACGRIDVLFANAGLSDCPALLDTDEAFFDELMGINLKGTFFTFTHALPWMAEGASAIFTSSVIQQRGRPGDALYAASKAAVRSLARTLAVDEQVLGRGIRVNVVSPGAIRTPMTARASEDPAICAWVEAQVPMGRWGEAEEVARAVLFLASSDGSYLTGGEIAVDGGLGQV